MTQPGACPDRQVLDEFLLGRLPEPQTEAVADHLLDCPSCQHRADAAPADPLVAALGRAPSVVEPMAVRRLLERLYAAAPADSPSGAADTDSLVLQTDADGGGLGRLGEYRLVRELGRGGMGVVYEAEDARLGRRIAVKVMRPEIAVRPEARRRFLREARAVAALDHEHVVPIHRVGEARVEGGITPFLVMPLLRGESLEARLAREERLPIAEVVRIGREAALGLAAAHAAGLVHRDVKPANLWLEDGPQRSKVKLLDFGLARDTRQREGTQTGIVLGTPAYMAPEQAAGGAASPACDLFSLGVVLYRATTGRLPFDGKDVLAVLRAVAVETPRPPHAVRADVPRPLSVLILRLLRKDPAGRPASAAAVAEELGGIALGRAPASRTRPVAVAIVVLLLGLIAAVARPWQQPTTAPPEEDRVVAEAPPPPELPRGPQPLDRLRRAGIGSGVRELAGGGDPRAVPEEFVTVLGSSRFRFAGPGGTPAYDPNGVHLAVPTGPNVILFTARTGIVRRVFPTGLQRVECVALSANGQMLAAVGTPHPDKPDHGYVWDVRSGEERTILHKQKSPVVAVAFSPDSRLCATAGVGGGVRIERVSGTGPVPPKLAGHRGDVTAVAFSPDGRALASISAAEGHARLWDTAKGTLLATLDHGRSVGPATLAFSPDGRTVATGDEFRLVLWDAASGEQLHWLDTPAAFVAFTLKGDVICTATHGSESPRTIRKWDVATGASAGALEVSMAGAAIRWTASPTGDAFALVRSGQQQVRLFDGKTGESLTSHLGHNQPVTALAVSPDGNTLLSGTVGGSVRLWNSATGKALRGLSGLNKRVYTVAWALDGRTVAAACRDQTARIWDTAEGKLLHTLEGHADTVYGVAFSPDGGLLATASGDGSVHLWNPATGSLVHTFAAGSKDRRFFSVAFSPDGRTLAAGGEALVLWDIAARAERGRWKPPATVDELAFLPDGRLVAGEGDGKVRLWDVRRGEATTWLEGPGAGTQGLAIRPDGHAIAVCSTDGSVHLWRIDVTPPRWRSFDYAAKAGNPAHTVVFSRDGRHLLTGHDDGTIHVLRLAGPGS